jgi:Arc/MetJ-type ribon-helix-helix transcriptional regulator
MTKKIAISLPDVTLDKARAAVKGRRAASLSGYIVRLIEDASASETFEQMLAEWVRESGASAAEIRAAEKESRAAFVRAGLLRRKRSHEKKARKAS